MKLAVLFSGGKDSTYAAWLAKKEGHELVCLITIESENQDSFMFHTPSIEKTKAQAEVMSLPLIIQKTKGEKEIELRDLKKVIKKVKEDFGIEGLITGAVGSVYQASRIQKICDDLNLKCVNPLWQKTQIELLEELVKYNFEIIIVGVAAYPLGKNWIGRKIDKNFIEDVKELEEKFRINPAGEGGEFESFVINCPLFNKGLDVKDILISGEGNAWRGEIII